VFALKQISNACTWLVDGTFRSAPPNFLQLITLQGYLYGKVYPLVYVLTINKKEETYFEVFKYIKNYIKFEPSTIVVDF
jgi:hypothetical protein